LCIFQGGNGEIYVLKGTSMYYVIELRVILLFVVAFNYFIYFKAYLNLIFRTPLHLSGQYTIRANQIWGQTATLCHFQNMPEDLER